MGAISRNFLPGQLFRGTVNGELFDVEDVREEPTTNCRHTVTAVYFRHQRTGQRVRVELATAQRLLLEEVPAL